MSDGERTGRDERRGPRPDPLVGRTIDGRFRVDAPIARGGMGKVYRATQVPLGREVALKILHPSYAGDQDPEFHKRFFREASIASRLSHPNTVTVFDYGRTDDDVYYIAMELLEGVTLRQAIRKEAPFPASRALHVARQICRSLREAHHAGVIHRDLKPANVFLVQHGDEADFVKVLDFGLVKDIRNPDEELTQTGLFMGSPKYMPPEQIRGEAVDPRADLYSLGVILFEMFTGVVPFDRASSMHTLMAHVHDAPPAMREVNPAADVTPFLEEIVQACMAKSPGDRFGTMDELLVALKHAGADFLSHEGFGSGDSGFGALPRALRAAPSASAPPRGSSAAYAPPPPSAFTPPGDAPRARSSAPPPPRASIPPPPAPAPAPAVPPEFVPPQFVPPEFDSAPTGRHVSQLGPVLASAASERAGSLPPADAPARPASPSRAAPSPSRPAPPRAAPPPQAAGSRRLGLVGLGAAVLGVGAISAAILLGRPADPSAGAEPAAASAPASALLPEHDEPAPRPVVPERTRVTFRSAPPGAAVVVGDTPRGTTPLELELPTAPSRAERVRFELDGHVTAVRDVTLAGAPLVVDVALAPVPDRAAPAPATPPSAAAVVPPAPAATAAPPPAAPPADARRRAPEEPALAEPTPRVSGYKDDPY